MQCNGVVLTHGQQILPQMAAVKVVLRVGLKPVDIWFFIDNFLKVRRPQAKSYEWLGIWALTVAGVQGKISNKLRATSSW